ncbi:S8 family serine peptidase [Microcella sp.]|uniref:S8 family serine peptidase n=1 Tax=Microcella sp. TaxID=1913979 RepID=UPI003F70CFB4
MRARPARLLSRPFAASLVAAGLLVAGLAPAAAPVLAPPAAADAVRDRQYWLDEYGIRSAWSVTRGDGVVIAIIDSGVDAAHPDLAGAVIGGTDVSGRGNATGTLPLGPQGVTHGTMVASLAAGRGSGPNAGVIGAAPAASVLSISLAFGPGERSGDDQIADAVTWAVDNGADIISLSLTRNQVAWPESWDTAFVHAEQNDVVVIAAAGNRGSGTAQVSAPATIPGVLTVGGVDRAGRASDNASAQGITIGVMAPSEGLVGAIPGGGHSAWQGTSGATPIVAGIAALVRAAHPELDAAGVINRIISTARPATAIVPDPNYGYGLIDAAAAVSAEVPAVDANPLGTLAEWIVLHRRADADEVSVELSPPRSALGREPAAPGLRMPGTGLAELGPIIPTVVIIAATLTALATLAAAAVLRFVTRTRSE